MYKDKEKQREANRERQRRYKAKQKALPNEGVTVTKTERHSNASDVNTAAALHQSITKPKRGKDIKCFADLPPDIQANINRLSETNEEKKMRTANAIRYQHLFPESQYKGTGIAPEDMIANPVPKKKEPLCAETGGGEGDGFCGR